MDDQPHTPSKLEDWFVNIVGGCGAVLMMLVIVVLCALFWGAFDGV